MNIGAIAGNIGFFKARTTVKNHPAVYSLKQDTVSFSKKKSEKIQDEEFYRGDIRLTQQEIKEYVTNHPYRTLIGIAQKPKFELIKDCNTQLAEKIFLDKDSQKIPTLQKDSWEILRSAKSEKSAKNKAILLELLLYDERFYTNEDFADFAILLLQKTNSKRQLQASVKMIKSKAYDADYKKSKKIARNALDAFIRNKNVSPGCTNYAFLIVQKAFSDRRIYEDIDLMNYLFNHNTYFGYRSESEAIKICQKLDQMLEN